METARIVPPTEGEVIGDSPDRRVEILSDSPELNATWSRFASGRDGADLHVHREHTDLFFVLTGELTVRLGPEDDEALVPSGSLARVPPLVVHGFRNSSAADVTYLNLHAPGRGFTDYMRSIRDGDPITYDQFDPPGDGGLDPALAAIGDREISIDEPGLRVDTLAGEAEVSVVEIRAGEGRTASDLAERPRYLFVLEGGIEVAGRAVGQGAWIEWAKGQEPEWSVPEGVARLLGVSAGSAGDAEPQA